MASIWQDLRYAFRVYSKNKSFTLMAALTLALGIGANAGLFTVINAVLLRPLPYHQPERIVQLYDHSTRGTSPVVGYPWFRFAERGNRAFEYLAAFGSGPRVNVTAGDSVQVVQTIRVSSDAFRVFGVHPEMGRNFTREDDQPGAAPVAIISDPLWRGLYASDPAILGRALRINGESYAIIGVMSPGFSGGPDADIWIPLRKAEDWTERFAAYFVIGRLRPEVTLEGARQDLDLVWARLRQEKPGFVNEQMLGATVTTYLESMVGDYRTPMKLLSGAAVCVLLIACVNVANLLLARAVARRKEIAVRIALGTSRSRLIRQLLTESLLLAGVSGAVGLGLAASLIHALKQWLTDQLIRGHEVSLDLRILWFTAVITILTGVAFGLVPAIQLARINPALALRDIGTVTRNRGTRRFRAGLIGAQIGLSAMILLAAGLLVKSFQNLRSDNLGFMAQGVLTVETSMAAAKLQKTAQVTADTRQLTDQLTSISGVQSVAVVSALPSTYPGTVAVGLLSDAAPASGNVRAGGEPRQITPGYFEVMRIPMRAGRAFTESDTATSTRVAIVNEAFIRKYLGRANPVGFHVLIGANSGQEYADQPREVVGVVTDTRGDRRMKEEAVPCIYVPMAQMPDATMAFHNSDWSWSWVVRTEGSPPAVSRQVYEAMRKAEPSWVIENPKLLTDVVGAGVEQQKIQTVLLSSFAAIALLLAAVGLYGTMSQTLAERRYELGVRLAIGATGRDILWLMISYSLKLIVAGLICGLAASVAFHRFIGAYLFAVRPTDPVVHAIVLTLLTTTGLGAALTPALRAARIDPKLLLQQ